MTRPLNPQKNANLTILIFHRAPRSTTSYVSVPPTEGEAVFVTQETGSLETSSFSLPYQYFIYGSRKLYATVRDAEITHKTVSAS